MENIIIMAILIILVGAASVYLVREKKKGRRCVGCPSGGCSPCEKCKTAASDNDNSN